MTKKAKIWMYVFSTLSFLVTISLLLIRFSTSATTLIMNLIHVFRNDITMEKIQKLYAFIECNIVFFFIYGISFLLLSKLEFSNSDGIKFKFFSSIKKLKINSYSLILFLVFLAISVIRFYWITQKQSFHMDELYGISIFHYNEYGLWSGKNFEKFQAYTGKQIRDLILFDDGSLKDTFKDLIHLWIYNRDTAYNNLFLVLSRIWYTGLETSDFKTIFWRASLLNYVFFCFSFYFLIRLLNEISDNKISKTFALVIAFLNPASIGLSVFMRSYALQEAVLILFTYLFVLYIKNVSQRKDINNKRNFLSTVIVLALVMNCDYFSIVYVGMLGLILIIYLIYNKEFKTLYTLICAFLTSLIISKLFYLNFGVGFFAGRGTEALSTLSSFGGRVKKSLSTVYDLVSNNFINLYVFLAFCLSSIIIYTFFQKEYIKSNNIRLCIFLSSLLWCLFVMLVAPYYTLRYIASIFPLFAVIFSFDNIKNKCGIILLIVSLGLMTFFASKNAIPLASNNSKIEHLNERLSPENFITDSNAVVYIDRNSLYTEILPYLDDNQICYFVDSLDELKSYNLKDRSYYYLKFENKTYDIIVQKFDGE